MLVHTNVRKLVHSDDREVVDKIMEDLTTPEITDKDGTSIPNKKYEKILELVYMAALKKTNDDGKYFLMNFSGGRMESCSLFAYLMLAVTSV